MRRSRDRRPKAARRGAGASGRMPVGTAQGTRRAGVGPRELRSGGGAARPVSKDLPLPPFYDPDSAERWSHRPDAQKLFEAAQGWRERHQIAPAAEDAFELHLLLIDVQKDFCFPEGTLYVGGRSGRGAIDDSRRMAEFIYRNLGAISRITTTMDAHLAFQIFFPAFWVDREGRALSPHRTVTAAQIRAGEARPNPAVASWVAGGDEAWLRQQALFYCEELERAGRYQLYLWPPHCLLGSEGHPLVGAVQEARLFHSYVRGAQSWVEEKGQHPLTENYSVLRPEVLTRVDGRPLAHSNTRLVETLLQADALVIAGQAASHCVKSTVDDLLEEVQARDPGRASRVYLLVDCMSAVAVPDGKGGFLADFTPQAEEALRRFEAAGVHLVRSTEPLSSWPGLSLG
jgi:nicotinamidase-related amidase